MASHPSPFEVPVESIADSVDTPRGSAYLNAPPGFARDSSAISTPAESSPFLAQGNKEANFIDSRDALPARRPLYKRTWFWVAAVVAVVVVALAVVLPVIFVELLLVDASLTTDNLRRRPEPFRPACLPVC